MTGLAHDLRHAVRLCRRATGTVAVIVGSLALGIGANTAVFSFVNAIQFKPLPVADEATLVDVSEWSATELCAGCGVGTSYPGYIDWKTQARSFSTLAAFKEETFVVSGAGVPARTGDALVSADLFPMIGVQPALERSFNEADDRAGAEPVVLIDDTMWRVRFDAHLDVTGRSDGCR
jgi:putative ABC transport system permease protein